MTNQSKLSTNNMPREFQDWIINNFIAIENQELPEELAASFFEFLETYGENDEVIDCFNQAQRRL